LHSDQRRICPASIVRLLYEVGGVRFDRGVLMY
jgi:hypothetical protein